MSIFAEEKDYKILAHMKRYMECATMLPEFKEEFQKDAEGTLAKYGLELTRLDLAAKVSPDHDFNKMKAIHPGRGMDQYLKFMKKKFEWRNRLRLENIPSNDTMKKWRERQIIRCEGALGARNQAIIHSVLAFELSSGCSVGCEFCGLNAGKLKKLFRYEPENAKLWQEVLEISKKILGPAAGRGTCYYATEPLDNPDYEKYIADFHSCFGHFPQITTAAAMRDLERTRALVADAYKEGDMIYRLSVHSIEQLMTIFEQFTPEELLFVELLPQYEEAPLQTLIHVGRNRREDEDDEGTIACMSGFIVNMAEQTIRLVTPVLADSQYPTGEVTLEKRTFANAEEFENEMLDIIRTRMKILIGPREKMRLYPYFSYEGGKGKSFLKSRAGYKITYDKKEIQSFMKELCKLLETGEYTKSGLVEKLEELMPGTEPEYIFWVLNIFWKQGILVDTDLYPAKE